MSLRDTSLRWARHTTEFMLSGRVENRLSKVGFEFRTLKACNSLAGGNTTDPTLKGSNIPPAQRCQAGGITRRPVTSHKLPYSWSTHYR